MTESGRLFDVGLRVARAGDEAAYTQLVAPLRPELHAYCYRMLGSVYDADDAVQDTMLRAWRSIGRFEGHSSLKSWLYKIATNVCLDNLSRRSRRALPADLRPSADHAVPDGEPLTDVPWLEPYPDDPDAVYELRESVELAFVAALQHLPGNQRAALLLFDVLGFSAREIADTMATSVASVNSALQRARKIVSDKQPAVSQQQTLRALDDEQLRKLVTDYTTALEQGDLDTLMALLTEDATWSMPPLPDWYRCQRATRDRGLPLGRGGPRARRIRHRRPDVARRPDRRRDRVHRRRVLRTVRASRHSVAHWKSQPGLAASWDNGLPAGLT